MFSQLNYQLFYYFIAVLVNAMEGWHVTVMVQDISSFCIISVIQKKKKKMRAKYQKVDMHIYHTFIRKYSYLNLHAELIIPDSKSILFHFNTLV